MQTWPTFVLNVQSFPFFQFVFFFSLQVGAVAKLGTDTVSGIYTFGKNRVTKAVDYGLQTPYGEFLLGQLDASLSLSEKMLDRYLPEEGGRSVIVKYKFIAHSN